MLRKTKIVCTIGPASDSEETIRELFKKGMNVSRHNFSHGTHESHKATMDRVKKVAKEMGVNYAIILDTKGPEIRLKKFKEKSVFLKEGSQVTVVGGGDFLGDENRFAMTYEDLNKVMAPGKHILINDGLVDLEVISIEGNEVKTIVRNSGEVADHKNSNLPGIVTNLPSITEKDIEDLKFAIENDVDIIAASFIRKAQDVLEIRRVLHQYGGDKIHIYSKIENQEGVDNLEEIIKYSDGIMVARGDMGVEIPLEEVPMVQKRIIGMCNREGKPVITATQMLDSMIRNPRPTRAEVSDVANAIMDGTDAVMLSGETASGKYPLEAVSTMAQIALEVEARMDYNNILKKKLENQSTTIQSAISSAVADSANKLDAKAIITGTQSGSTARNIAKFRPKATIIAVTPDESVSRRLNLIWGVLPIVSETFKTTDELIEKTTWAAKEKGYVNEGDLVVISAGIPVNYVGSTNMMKIHIIGEILLKGQKWEQQRGIRTGRAMHVSSSKEAEDIIRIGDIMITKDFTDDYKDVLKKATAVIVESESLSSEMATLCFQMDIPVIYRAQNAFELIKNGSIVTVDGKRGIVLSGKMPDSLN